MVTHPPSRRPAAGVWNGRSVLVTGHTGFKGSWLTRWLHRLGADVHGLALDPPTDPSLFMTARVGETMTSDHRADVRDPLRVAEVVAVTAPSVVFHMAAQPLVRDGYRLPGATFATNVMGTVNVLEAARHTRTVEAIVVITTDKVYLPPHLAAPAEDGSSVAQPEGRPHREGDPLGAEDPYGWSKVAAEYAVAAFRALPEIDGSPVWTIPMATARAGNVLGGGDWSSERLVPDCIRSFMRSEPVKLRYPEAVRPWQHVLDPLNGYLVLAEDLLDDGEKMARSFNFGPRTDDERTVGEVAERLARLWGSGAEARHLSKGAEPHENPMLRLDSTMAEKTLGWSPVWNLDETLRRTVEWYRAVADGMDAAEVTDRQIAQYAKSGAS